MKIARFLEGSQCFCNNLPPREHVRRIPPPNPFTKRTGISKMDRPQAKQAMVPTNFAKKRVSVSTKINVNIIAPNFALRNPKCCGENNKLFIAKSHFRRKWMPPSTLGGGVPPKPPSRFFPFDPLLRAKV